MANRISFIIQLQDKFSAIARKVDNATKKMSRSTKKLSQRLKELQVSSKKVGKSLASMGAKATVVATVPIALLGRSMLKAASDATETANKFNAVFDDVENKANQVADNFSKSFGLAGSTSRELIASTGDLLVGFGFTGDAALEISEKVNKLAADLVSFQNTEGGVTAASAALTKALLGETESAKSLGIVIRQNDKAFKAQIKIIMRTQRVSEMQAKAIAILDVATRQSSKAIGDVSRTWDDYASVVRRSQQSTLEMRESFGKLLIPLARKALLAFTALVNKLNNLSKPMKVLILIIAGLVAVAGPLLLLLAGIALAFSVISLPVLAVVGAVGLLIAAGIALAANWNRIVSGMKALWQNFANFIVGMGKIIGDIFVSIWDKVLVGLIDMVNTGIRLINGLLAPLNFVLEKLGLNKIGIKEIQTPTAPASPSGTLSGEIKVSASGGATVESASLTTKGNNLNVGMNVAPEGA